MLRDNHLLPIRFGLTVTGVLPPFLQTVDDEVTYFSGFVNHADGTQSPLYSVQDELKYDR